MELLTKKDVHAIGNLGMISILKGLGDLSMPLLELVQSYRPNNAGGFIAEALYLTSIGEVNEALSIMEDTLSGDVEVNKEEALAFHLFLLIQSGDFEQAYDISKVYLDEGLLSDIASVNSAREIHKLAAHMLNRDVDLMGYNPEDEDDHDLSS